MGSLSARITGVFFFFLFFFFAFLWWEVGFALLFVILSSILFGSQYVYIDWHTTSTCTLSGGERNCAHVIFFSLMFNVPHAIQIDSEEMKLTWFLYVKNL